MPETLHHAPIAIVDEDQSPLSQRIASAFYPPALHAAGSCSACKRWTPAWTRADFTFALTIPPDFQRDVLAGKKVELQLNVDATRMSQAFSRQRLHPADRAGRGATNLCNATARQPARPWRWKCARASTPR